MISHLHNCANSSNDSLSINNQPESGEENFVTVVTSHRGTDDTLGAQALSVASEVQCVADSGPLKLRKVPESSSDSPVVEFTRGWIG